MPPNKRTLGLLIAYAAASLLHHVHNAEFLRDYPNLPESVSRGAVYAAWLGEALVGVVGYLLLRLNYKRTGLGIIGVYALLGFGGLAHYFVAPISAHTLAMNVTILLEVLCAALLLGAVLRRFAS